MKKIYIHTIGCALNRAESLRMAGILRSEGYEIVNSPEDADLVIINTCTVKTPAENKTYRLLRKLSGKKIILTGCLVEHRKDLIDSIFKDYSIVGLYSIDKISEAVRKTLAGERVVIYELKKLDKSQFPSLDEYPIRIIPAQEGCLWNCKYCATKLARRVLNSIPPRRVYEEIEDAVRKGLRIIYLTGTDMAAYGKDIGITLADLLRGIRNIPGLYFVRVGMANPGILNEYLQDLLEAYEDPRIFKFFHIPVQSGSNKVLKDMGRRYTVEEFLEIVEVIRRKFPEASIATDIIAGYPTETEEDFEKTLNLIRKVKFDVVNISRFWPRPLTEAAKLKQLPSHIVKARSKRVAELFNETAKERNRIWLGWKGWIIIESKGRIPGSWIGRNYAYKQVIVKSDEDLLGKFVRVKINEVTAVDLRGEIIEIEDEINIEEWERSGE